mmetsp:Transcript_12855/g.38641  ORF Transcript_12855/g.38641 Transcript_12855/m.38641 type:complete len:320 (+) Transcript_12855:471-1430(+)
MTLGLVCGGRVAVHLIVRQLERHLHRAVPANAVPLQQLAREGIRLEGLELRRRALRVEAGDCLPDGGGGGAVDVEPHRPKLWWWQCGGRPRRREHRQRVGAGEDFVKVPQHGGAVAPRVLKVDSGPAVGAHHQLERLVEPPVPAGAVQRRPRVLDEPLGRRRVERDHKHRRIDRVHCVGVPRAAKQVGPCGGPLVASQRREHPDRSGIGHGRRQDGPDVGLDLWLPHQPPRTVQHVKGVKVRPALHHDVPGPTVRHQLILGYPRYSGGLEEPGVLRHVQRIRPGGVPGVPRELGRHTPHRSVKGGVGRQVWFGVKDVGL